MRPAPKPTTVPASYLPHAHRRDAIKFPPRPLSEIRSDQRAAYKDQCFALVARDLLRVCNAHGLSDAQAATALDTALAALKDSEPNGAAVHLHAQAQPVAADMLNLIPQPVRSQP